MLPASYEELNRLQATHWWYRAQFDTLGKLLAKYAPGRFDSALDVGCGSGGFTRLVSSFAHRTTGVDVYEPALAHARERHPDIEFVNADANNLAGLPADAFDLVTLFYVLYHEWADEDAMLTAIASRLREDGLLLIADSAFPVLFRRHDRAARAVRRYTRKSLAEVLGRNGFEVVESAYLNAALFPPALAVAMLDRVRDAVGYRKNRPPELNLEENSPWMNRLMFRLLTVERAFFAPFGSPPVGINLVALARKKRGGR